MFQILSIQSPSKLIPNDGIVSGWCATNRGEAKSVLDVVSGVFTGHNGTDAFN